MLGNEYEELKLKIKSITKINDSLEISNSCNEKCHEDVFVETCDDLIVKENDELKQKIEMLIKDLARLKDKSIEINVQSSQDNREDIVKKLEKGSTVTALSAIKKVTSPTSALNQRRSFRMRRTRRNLQSRVFSSTPSPTGETKAIEPPM